MTGIPCSRDQPGGHSSTLLEARVVCGNSEAQAFRRAVLDFGTLNFDSEYVPLQVVYLMKDWVKPQSFKRGP